MVDKVSNGGSWNDADSWSPTGIPTSSDDATISGGTVTLDGILGTADSLTLSAATATLDIADDTLTIVSAVSNAGSVSIQGESALISSGTFTNTGIASLMGIGGTIDAMGRFVNDGYVVSADLNTIEGTFANNADGILSVMSGTLSVTGTVADTGAVTISSDASLTNTGTWDLTPSPLDSGITLGTGEGTFVNDGSFSAGGFFSNDFVGVQFVNGEAGTISVDETVNLEFMAGLDDAGSISIGGDGYLTLDGGTSTIAGLVSGSGILAVAGGDVTLASGASLTAGGFDLSGGTATIATDLTYAGVYAQSGGVLDILSGDTLTLTGASDSITGGTIIGSGRLVNEGTLTSNSSSTNAIAAGFTNDAGASISVASGTLDLSGGFSDAGSVGIVGGATLELDGGTSTIAGLVNGSGTLAVAGGDVTLAAGASLTTAGFDLSGGTATIATDLTYAGVYAQSGGVLDILSGDTLTLTGASDSITGGTIIGGGRLVNEGTLTSSHTLSGTNTIAAALTNEAGASISVASGMLDLSGGFSDAGSVSIMGGATLELDGGTSTISSPINGSGTLAIAGGSTTFVSGASLPVANFDVEGGSATIATSLLYAGSYDQSGGAVDVLSGVTVTFNAIDATISGGTLTNSNDAYFAQEANLSISGSGSIVNQGEFSQYGITELSGGTGILNDGDYYLLSETISGSGTVSNGGFFASEGLSTIGAAFRNDVDGQVTADSGTLAFTGVVGNEGDVSIATGATLTSSGTWVAAAYSGNTSVIGGGGNFINSGAFLSGSVGDIAGTNSVAAPFTNTATGSVDVERSTLAFSAAVVDLGTTTIDGCATITSSDAWSLDNASIGGGTMGAGTFVNTGFFSSQNSGAGANTIAATVINGPAATIRLTGGSLDLTGGLEDAGRIAVNQGAVLDIDGGTSTIAGLIGGKGTFYLQAGDATLAAGASISTAFFGISGFSASHAELTVATNLSYAGEFDQEQATLNIRRGNTLTLSGTSNEMGDATVVGHGTLLNQGQLFFENDRFAQVTVSNAGTIGQGEDLTLAFGASVVNQAGAVYSLSSASIENGGFAGQFVNDGQFISSVSSCIFPLVLTPDIDFGSANVVDVRFVNDSTGTISVAAGTLDYTDGLSDTGMTTIAAGATLELDGGCSTIAALISGGSGTLYIAGGTATFAAGASIAAESFGLVGGTATIDTPLTLAGNYYQSGDGVLDLASGQALILTNVFNNTLSGGTITGSGVLLNQGALYIYDGTVSGTAILRNGATGSIVQLGGDFSLADAAMVQNHAGGLYQMESGATISGGAETSFVNAGRFISSGSTTNTIFAPFTNTTTGTISVASGTLFVEGTVTDGGATTIAGGAQLYNDGSWNLGNASIAGGGSFVNEGLFASTSTETNTVGAGLYFVNETDATIAVGSGNLAFAGDVADYGFVTITGDATLTSSASWDLVGQGCSSTVISGGGTFVNDGSFNGSSFQQQATIVAAAAFVNSSGASIEVSGSSDVLSFTGGLNDYGSVGINNSDTLQIDGGASTIAGLVGGSGSLAVAGGTATFAAGTTLTMGEFQLIGGTAAIDTNLTYGGAYEQFGGTLDLAGGEVLTLARIPSGGSGPSLANGLAGGTITGSGVLLNQSLFAIVDGEMSGSAILRNGATGTIRQQGGSLCLTDTAMVQNHLGGVYELTNASIYESGMGAGFVNSGNFVSYTYEEGSGNTIVPAFINSSTGTISSAAGVLIFKGGLDDTGTIMLGTQEDFIPGQVNLAGGASTIAGSVSGFSGTLAILGGTATFAAGASLTEQYLDLSGGTAAIDTALTYAGIYTQDGGTLDLATGGSLILTGPSNMLIAGTVGGSGVLLNQGELDIFSATVSDTAILRNGAGGTILQYGDLDVAAEAQVQNHLGGVYILENNAAILDGPETTSFINGGSFISTTSVTNTVAVNFTNNATGSVTVVSGTLDFDRSVRDAGTATIDSGAALVNSDGWVLTGGASISGGGFFTNEGGFINAAGTNSVAVGTFTNDDFIDAEAGTLAFAGVVMDYDYTDILAGATVTSGGTWDLNGVSISGPTSGGAGSFVNAGRFISTQNSSGTNSVVPAFTNTNTGSVTVASGTLDLTGGFNDSGSVTITGTALELGGGTSTISGTIVGEGLLDIAGGDANFITGASLAMGTFDLAGGTATVATNLSYGGIYFQNGGTLDLGSSDTLTLTGPGNALTGGTIDGAGVLLNAGTLDISGVGGAVGGSATLDNGVDATINQSFDLTVGALATVENDGTYNLNGASIVQGGTGASFINDGNFNFTSETLENISTAFTNDAFSTLRVASGTLDLSSSAGVTNNGTIEADTGSLSIAGALSGTGADELSGAANLTLGGSVSSGQTVTFETEATGKLDLGQAQSFAGTVAGLTHSNAIDLTNFLFSGGPTITGITGTGAVNTTTDVTIKDGSQTATLDLLNQTANQYSTSTSAYQLVSDNRSPSAGTLFQLAAV